MPGPRIYIHRTFGCPYADYMPFENEALLSSFADVVNDGPAPEAVSPGQMPSRLHGVDGILSLNGSGAPEITREALLQAGTVRVAVISHYWHGLHDTACAEWEEAGVEVIDESDPCNEAVAEWTIGAAIAGLRRFEQYDREMKAGAEWPSWRRAGQLNGSTASSARPRRAHRPATATFDVRVLAMTSCRGAALECGTDPTRYRPVTWSDPPVLPQTRMLNRSLADQTGGVVNSARAAIRRAAFRPASATPQHTSTSDSSLPMT